MNASCATSSASAGDPSAASAARYTAVWCRFTSSPKADASPSLARASRSASLTRSIDSRNARLVGGILFPDGLDERFHVGEIFLERAAPRRREPVLGPRQT